MEKTTNALLSGFSRPGLSPTRKLRVRPSAVTQVCAAELPNAMLSTAPLGVSVSVPSNTSGRWSSLSTVICTGSLQEPRKKARRKKRVARMVRN